MKRETIDTLAGTDRGSCSLRAVLTWTPIGHLLQPAAAAIRYDRAAGLLAIAGGVAGLSPGARWSTCLDGALRA